MTSLRINAYGHMCISPNPLFWWNKRRQTVSSNVHGAWCIGHRLLATGPVTNHSCEAVSPTCLPSHLPLNYQGSNHASTFENNRLQNPSPGSDVPQLFVSKEHTEGLSIAKPRLSSSSSPAFMQYELGSAADNEQYITTEEENLARLSCNEHSLYQTGLSRYFENACRDCALPSSLVVKCVEIQDESRRGSCHNGYHPIDHLAEPEEIICHIQSTCKIATGEVLSTEQAQYVKCCGDGLNSSMLSKVFLIELRAVLLRCHQHPLPSIDASKLDSTLTACVAYYRYLNSIPRSASKIDDVYRRFAQIWLHIYFEYYINELREREKDCLLEVRRQGRQISTVARDSILRGIYGNQYSPQKKDRDAFSDQCRWGNRWWRVARCVGLGVVLLANEDLAKQMYAQLWPKMLRNLLIC